MSSLYTILIPIHNEVAIIGNLLNGLKSYADEGHEIIIIDDGSNDGSGDVLKDYNFIKIITLKENLGKGEAIKKGLFGASKSKIIIFDGDMELNTSDIKNLMILNSKKNIYGVFGSRFEFISPFKSKWDFGNYIFTKLFNFVHNSDLNDALCCAKSFYRKDIINKKINSSKFDIDVELASLLIKKFNIITTVIIGYNRRTKTEGKKLRIFDSFNILIRILKSIKLPL